MFPALREPVLKELKRKYNQDTIEDVPLEHVAGWLAFTDPKYAGVHITEGFSKENLYTLMTFMLGWLRQSPLVRHGFDLTRLNTSSKHSVCSNGIIKAVLSREADFVESLQV